MNDYQGDPCLENGSSDPCLCGLDTFDAAYDQVIKRTDLKSRIDVCKVDFSPLSEKKLLYPFMP